MAVILLSPGSADELNTPFYRAGSSGITCAKWQPGGGGGVGWAGGVGTVWLVAMGVR